MIFWQNDELAQIILPDSHSAFSLIVSQFQFGAAAARQCSTRPATDSPSSLFR
jgi:hypothetical protein